MKRATKKSVSAEVRVMLSQFIGIHVPFQDTTLINFPCNYDNFALPSSSVYDTGSDSGLEKLISPFGCKELSCSWMFPFLPCYFPDQNTSRKHRLYIDLLSL